MHVGKGTAILPKRPDLIAFRGSFISSYINVTAGIGRITTVLSGDMAYICTRHYYQWIHN